MTYFESKSVWVTGASSGIGEALCYALDKAGAKIILSSRNAKGLEKVRQNLKQTDALIVPLDLADPDSLPRAVEKVMQKIGRIDILINNGGISQRSLAIETNTAVDQRIMHVNYFGTVALTKLVLPIMLAQQSGHIVTVSSVAGLYGTPYRSAYAASKHALHGFFDSLRAELHQKGIYVTLICPGFVNTAISIHALTGDGTPLNSMDAATSSGIQPDVFAQKMLAAIAAKHNRKVIGGFKEKFGIFMKRFYPSLFDKLIVRIKVR